MGKEGLASVQDIEDFTRGTDFLSANGGGVPEETRALLKDDLKRGLELSWVDLEDLADDANVVCTFFSGSIAPGSFDRAEMERQLGLEHKVERPLVAAVGELEAFTGKKFDTMISVEIGGINTGLAFDAAANLGLRMVNADYAGRAIPEADCITPNIFGKRIYPMACVDYYGDVTYLKDAQHNRMAERLSKFIASASFGIVGCAAIILSGKEVKEIAVPATLSECLAIGRAIREAREKGQDPIQAVIDQLGQAWVLFRGTIVSREWEDRDGYMFGTTHIGGSGDYEGQTLDVWFKNENHVSWLNGKPWVCSPDLITLAYRETGEGISNPDIKEGDDVVAVGMKGLEAFRTESGLNEAAGPRYFGFDIDYEPIERLMEESR